MTIRYTYRSDDDNADATMWPDNTVVDKYVEVLGGVSRTVHYDTTQTTSWNYPNVHGDVMAQTDVNGNKQGNTYTYDPFGQPLAGTPNTFEGNFEYGWLGTKQRGTETEMGLNTVEMGARQYIAGLGRFLEVDPVEGGSANDYDYCDADPINCTDLDGNRNWRKILTVVAVVVVVVAVVVVACSSGVACGAGIAIAANAARIAATRVVAPVVARASGRGIGVGNVRVAVHKAHKSVPKMVKANKAKKWKKAKHNRRTHAHLQIGKHRFNVPRDKRKK